MQLIRYDGLFPALLAILAGILLFIASSDASLAAPPGVATITFIANAGGSPATIDRGLGSEVLEVNDMVEIGDVIETNSDRVQFADTYGGSTRMGPASHMEMMAARPEIEALFPGLTFSPWFLEGEVLRKGPIGKYRTTCWIGSANSNSVIFLQPGAGPNQDRYFALTEYTNIWDDHFGSWTMLFELNPGQKGTLDVVAGIHQLPALIEPITTGELDYITANYLDDSLWGPEAVGGVAAFGELAGLPAEAADATGGGVGLLAGVIASAVAAGAVALGGAAWYARRRLR